MSNNDAYFNNHEGGCLEYQVTGNANKGGQDIKPNFSKATGTIEVDGSGRVTDRGLSMTNGAGLKSSGPTYYTENGARRIDASKATDSCVVEVNGVKMMLGAAKRMGLITDQGDGKLVDTTQEALERAQQDGQEQQEGEAPVSFADEATNGTLMALDDALGRDGTIQVSQSVIGHLSSAKWTSPMQAFEAAGKSLANRTGVDPAVAQAAVVEAYDGYRAACVKHLNAMGQDAEAVLEFATTCSPAVRSQMMQQILLGKGKVALNDMVRRMHTRQRQ